MKFEQQPRSRETRQETMYVVQSDDFKEIELSRDDILEEAALILEGEQKFPDPRGKKANHLRAKRAIREALINHGAGEYFSRELERQISSDAYEVLDLFEK